MSVCFCFAKAEIQYCSKASLSIRLPQTKLYVYIWILWKFVHIKTIYVHKLSLKYFTHCLQYIQFPPACSSPPWFPKKLRFYSKYMYKVKEHKYFSSSTWARLRICKAAIRLYSAATLFFLPLLLSKQNVVIKYLKFNIRNYYGQSLQNALLLHLTVNDLCARMPSFRK